MWLTNIKVPLVTAEGRLPITHAFLKRLPNIIDENPIKAASEIAKLLIEVKDVRQQSSYLSQAQADPIGRPSRVVST